MTTSLYASAEDFYANAPARIKGCRGQQHHWAKIRPTSILPRGLRTEFAHGVMVLVFTCLDGCGTERRLKAKPGGSLSVVNRRFSYKYMKEYHAPREAGVTKAGCFDATWQEAQASFAQIAEQQRRDNLAAELRENGAD